MEICGRDYAHLFCWTPAGGCRLYEMRRDRAFWALLYEALAGFWWQHVVPAKARVAFLSSA